MKTRSDDLQIFLSVVDAGGFSLAAQELDMPVAKISRAVQRLETRLQTTLLYRTTRRVSLTDEGRTFAQQIRLGLDQLEQAEENLRLLHEAPSGRLRIDAATPFMLHQIVPHIPEFQSMYPRISLELSTSEGIIDLLERRTDVAIRIGKLEDSSLHARLLGRSQLHLVAAPEYLAAHDAPSTPDDLAAHKHLGFISPTNLNIWSTQDGSTHEIQPDLSANSGEVLRALCLAGQGLAYLSNFMIADDLTSGRLQKVLSQYSQSPTPREQVQAVYYRNTALSARIKVFLDFLEPRLKL